MPWQIKYKMGGSKMHIWSKITQDYTNINYPSPSHTVNCFCIRKFRHPWDSFMSYLKYNQMDRKGILDWWINNKYWYKIDLSMKYKYKMKYKCVILGLTYPFFLLALLKKNQHFQNILMAYCKTAVTPLLKHRCFGSLALSHRYGIQKKIHLPNWQFYLGQAMGYFDVLQYITRIFTNFYLIPCYLIKRFSTAKMYIQLFLIYLIITWATKLNDIMDL